MKKRITAICLVLVMLLCALPFAAAAEDVEPELWISLDNHLQRTGYPLEENQNEIAVGDELSVRYQDNVPAQLYVDGVKVHDFPAGEGEYFTFPVRQTGKLDISLKQGDKEILHRTFNVISSKDMYSKDVKKAFSDLFSFQPDPPYWIAYTPEEIEYYENHGAPVRLPFLNLVKLWMSVTDVFMAIFSFTRIVR